MRQSRSAKFFAKPQLKEVIRSQGRQQTWIARRIGVSKFMMSHIVAGRRPISVEQGETVSQLLGVPLFLLFELPTGNIAETNGNDRSAA